MENHYEIPLKFQVPDSKLCTGSSEEDFVDVDDLPRLKNSCNAESCHVGKTCLPRHHSLMASSHCREEAKKHKNAASANLRRVASTAAASYQPGRAVRTTCGSGCCCNEERSPIASKRCSHLQRQKSMGDQPTKTKIDRTAAWSSFDAPMVKGLHPGSVSQCERVESASERLTGKEEASKRRMTMDAVERRTIVKEDDYNHRPRAHTLGTHVPCRITLRDSAIDLVSDDEDSEAYTAVSLAGTLNSKSQMKIQAPDAKVKRHRHRKFYIIIAALCGVILLLGGLGVGLALALFK